MAALYTFHQFRVNALYMHSAFGMCKFLGMGKAEPDQHGRFIRVEVDERDTDMEEFEISSLTISGWWQATAEDIPQAMYRAQTEYYKYPMRDKSFYQSLFASERQRHMILEDPREYRCQCGGNVLLCYNRPRKGKCEPVAVKAKQEKSAKQLELF